MAPKEQMCRSEVRETLDLRGVTKDLRIEVVERLVGLVGAGSAIVVVNEGGILSILFVFMTLVQPWGEGYVRPATCFCFCFCDTSRLVRRSVYNMQFSLFPPSRVEQERWVGWRGRRRDGRKITKRKNAVNKMAKLSRFTP